MEMKMLLCILGALVVITSAFPQGQRFGFNRGRGMRGMGRFRGMGRGRPFNGQGPPPPMMMCGRDTEWSDLQALDCSSYSTDITTKIGKLYSGEDSEIDEVFRTKITEMRNNRGANFDCEEFKCFAYEMLRKIFSDGLPEFCNGRTEDAPDFSGMASLMGDDIDDKVLIDNFKDGFCFGMNKKSYITQLKIVKGQLGLPDHGMPGHGGPMRHRFREQADCGSYDASTAVCTDIKPNEYINAMYGNDADAWDTAIEQKKGTIMAIMARDGPSGMCRVKACYKNALEEKMRTNNGEMPSACRSLYEQRQQIFSQGGFSDNKIKLISCFFAFKASINYRITQATQCDATTANTLNDLYSESPSVVDAAVQRIMTAWENARESGRMESDTISDEMVCRFKAIKEKLQQMNDELPSFCEDALKFDSNLNSASLQDVKELLCFKMEKLSDHMFN